MEKMKYASQNMPIPGSAQLFTQKKKAVTALVCSWNLRASDATWAAAAAAAARRRFARGALGQVRLEPPAHKSTRY